MDYKLKYIKYKQKYLQLKNQYGGTNFGDYDFSDNGDFGDFGDDDNDDNDDNNNDDNNNTNPENIEDNNFINFLNAILQNNLNKIKDLFNIKFIHKKKINLFNLSKNASEKQKKFLSNTSNNLKTPLIYASIKGNIELVKLLLNDGITDNDFTKLNKCETGIILLKAKLIIDEIDKFSTYSLIYASMYNHIEIVELLLSKGANINCKDKNGISSLMYASINGNIQIVKLLLSKGAKINNKDDKNTSSIMYATINNHIEIIKLLLSKRAKIHDKDDNGTNSLMYASINGNMQIIKLLLSKGADINSKDKNGINPLIYASIHGHLQIVKFLLSKGADINDSDNNSINPLMYASMNGNTSIVKYLLEIVDIQYINTRDIYGWSFLMYATWKEKYDIVKELLEKKDIDINNQDIYWFNSLMIASQNHGIDNRITMLLLGKNDIIDKNAKDFYGFDYLKCACWNSNSDKICDNTINYTQKVGIANIGQTCWMNSLIQCLAHIDIFANIFLDNDFESKIKDNIYINFLQNFAKIIKLIYSPNIDTSIDKINKKQPFINSKFINIFKESIIKTNSLFGELIDGKQQDANQGFLFMIDAIIQGFNEFVSNMKSDTDSTEPVQSANKKYLDANLLLNKMFKIVFKDYLSNSINGNMREKEYIENIMNLSIFTISTISLETELISNIYTSIDKLLEKVVIKEHFDYTNNKTDFISLPEVLIINFKRHQNEQKNYKTSGYNSISIKQEKIEKIETYVDFPIKLVLNNYFINSENKDDNKYELCSVCYHFGGYGGGHYISICKCDDGWYKFDDKEVTRVNIKEIVTNNAYMLFYKRIVIKKF